MRKLPITINGKTCYLDLDVWEKEQEWMKQREMENHKRMVEFFNKIHYEADKIRRLSNQAS